LHDALLRLWSRRRPPGLTGIRLRQHCRQGSRPDGSRLQTVFARLNQESPASKIDFVGGDALRYD